jgi:hypothetical protein
MASPLLQAKPRLGDLLVTNGFLTQQQLEQALEEQRDSGGRKLLGEVLIEREYCSEEHVLECLAVDFGVP